MVTRVKSDGAKATDCTDNCPIGWHKIRLFSAAPNNSNDFHFYRQDGDGTWSNKPGNSIAVLVPDPSQYSDNGVNYNNCGDLC